MKKLLLPLLMVAVSGLAAEPPAVKSKAAKELLKHPEFKKALEVAPEFTKAVLAELDKHAPEEITKAEEDAVSYMVRHRSSSKAVPIYNSKNKNWPEHAVKFFDGWTLPLIKITYGGSKDGLYESIHRVTDSAIFGKKVYSVRVRHFSDGQNMAFYNKVLGKNTGHLIFYLDANDGKVVSLCGVGTGVEREFTNHITPHGKKLGYK